MVTTLAEEQAKAANQGKPGYDVFGDPVQGKPLATGGADSTGLPPALIATSGTSRSQYNDNVTKMNTALTNVAAGAGAKQFNYVDKTGKVQTLNANSSDEALTKIQSLGADPHSGVEEVQKPEVKTNPDGTKVTTNPDGTTKTDNPDGSSTSTTTDGMELPSDVKKQYDDVITQADATLQQRQDDIDAAKATVANDPAANAALDAIRHQYDVLINSMKEKNKILLGGYQVGQARSGAMQFANEMSSNFMSEEMDKANGRISDLVTKENDLLLKTTIAYKTGNVKALHDAQTAYDKANSDKLKAIGDLAKATSDHVKDVQAQEKIDAADLKADINTKNSQKQDVVNFAQSSGDTATASAILQLDPTSPTFTQDLAKLQSQIAIKSKNVWSEPYSLGTNIVQKNSETGEIRTAVNPPNAPAAPKKTKDEEQSDLLSSISDTFIPGATVNGIPTVDADGAITPEAWKSAINEKGVNRANFIAKFATDIIGVDGKISAKYGLTPKEISNLGATVKTK